MRASTWRFASFSDTDRFWSAVVRSSGERCLWVDSVEELEKCIAPKIPLNPAVSDFFQLRV
jgi:hypothetical protein